MYIHNTYIHVYTYMYIYIYIISIIWSRIHTVNNSQIQQLCHLMIIHVTANTVEAGLPDNDVQTIGCPNHTIS